MRNNSSVSITSRCLEQHDKYLFLYREYHKGWIAEALKDTILKRCRLFDNSGTVILTAGKKVA